MHAIFRCHSHDYRQAPTHRSATESRSSSRSSLRCTSRFHGALHASARGSRFLQELFVPAVVAIEHLASGASVTMTTSSLTAACACANESVKSRPRSHSPRLVKILISNDPKRLSSFDKEGHDILSNAFARWSRSCDFATAIRHRRRFTRRGLPHGLAPVHRSRENTCAASLSSTSSNDFCNANLRNVVTPVGLFVASRVLTDECRTRFPVAPFPVARAASDALQFSSTVRQ